MSDPSEERDADERDDGGPLRPRGFFKSAAIAGAVAAAAMLAAALLPQYAP